MSPGYLSLIVKFNTLAFFAVAAFGEACFGSDPENELRELVKLNREKIEVAYATPVQGPILRVSFFDDEQLFNATLPLLRELRSLNWLELYRIKVSPDNEKELSSLRIKRLSYERKGDTSEEVKWVQNLKVVEKISLAKDKTLSDAAIDHLSSLPNLKELDVSFTSITGRCFAKADGFRSLKSLNLYGCPVDDEGLKAICNVKQLMVLDIMHTTVTAGGLTPVIDMHHLVEFSFALKGKENSSVMQKLGLAHFESKKRAREAGEDVPPDALTPFSYYIRDLVPKPTRQEVLDGVEYERKHRYEQPPNNPEPTTPAL